jgi:hypothetical protein
MASPYVFGPPKIDFSPLASLLDPIIEAAEKQKQEKLMLAALAPEAPVAPTTVPSAGGTLPLNQSRTPSFTGGGAKMAMPPEAFAPIVKQAAAEHGVDEGMMARLLAQESNWNPQAVSHAGAMGVAQFMPGTAKRFGINPWDPSQAIPAAAKYVAQNRELLGNDGLALAGYNWGEGNVQKWLASGADPSRVPRETRDYVQKITGQPIDAWAKAGRTQVAQADLPQSGGTPAQYAVPGQPAPASTDASPQKLQALKALAVSGAPAQRQWALNEISRLTTAKNPMNLGNGILYDPRTGKITDYSAAATKKPEAIQLYEKAKEEGFTGNFMDFKKATTGGNTTVNNILPADKTHEVEQAKDYSKFFTETQSEARSADVALGNLKVMDKLIDSPEFYSGTGGTIATSIKRAMVSMGIKDANAAQPNELFEKLANRALLDASGGKLGAGFSNADREFMGRTGANIENTPVGNRAIIRMAMKSEMRKKEIAQMARDYAKRNKGRLGPDFDQALAEWAEANPAFGEEIKALEAAGAPISNRMPPGVPPPATAPTGGYRIIRRIPDA